MIRLLILLCSLGIAAERTTQPAINEASTQSISLGTAKEHLKKALKEAKAWQTDAVLWQIAAGSFINLSGRLASCEKRVPESGWTYFFWSKSDGRLFEVMVCGDQVVGKGLGAGNLKSYASPLEKKFIDTDSVARVIGRALVTEKCVTKEPTWSGRLRYNYGAIRSEWSVEVHCSEETTLEMIINGSSGTVLSSAVTRDESPD